MNEIATQKAQLPDVLEDLSKFALIGREKLNAVRAEIRAIEKVGLAREVHEQKLKEAQEIAEAVLDAEVKIGELTAKIPKASGGDRKSDRFKNDTTVDYEMPKSKALSDIGIPQRTAERFERLARHPEAVEKAKAKARENGDVVTRKAVLDQIHRDQEKSEHILKRKRREALKRHEEFIEKQQEGVIGITDYQQDKEDRKVSALKTHKMIRHSLDSVIALRFGLNSTQVQEMAKVIAKEENKATVKKIDMAIQTLSAIKGGIIS